MASNSMPKSVSWLPNILYTSKEAACTMVLPFAGRHEKKHIRCAAAAQQCGKERPHCQAATLILAPGRIWISATTDCYSRLQMTAIILLGSERDPHGLAGQHPRLP